MNIDFIVFFLIGTSVAISWYLLYEKKLEEKKIKKVIKEYHDYVIADRFNNLEKYKKKQHEDIFSCLYLLSNHESFEWYNSTEYMPVLETKIYIKCNSEDHLPYITKGGICIFTVNPMMFDNNILFCDKWAYVNPNNPIKVNKE